MISRAVSAHRRKAFRKRIVRPKYGNILLKACICLLILEMAFAVRYLADNPVSIQRTEETVTLEQRVVNDSDMEQSAVYGIQFRWKEGELRFFKTLIN